MKSVLHSKHQMQWTVISAFNCRKHTPFIGSSRNLYRPNDAMMDIQVDAGDTPQSAHLGYWKNETVIRETAQLFYDYASH